MLAKKYRVKNFYLKNYKIIKTSLFSLRYSNLDESEVSKFGFVISKKIDKRAVVRNKLKRKIRKCVEDLIPEINKGKSIIFYPTKLSIEVTQEELREEIFKNLNNEGLLIRHK